MTTTILGAGLAGLSSSWHLGHDHCVVFEKSAQVGGHAGSESRFGFTYDHGPHVSFTKHDYVRKLFASNTQGMFAEYPVSVRNYYQGVWIEHPAQAHAWQIPEPIRDRCVSEMLAAAARAPGQMPENYGQWLQQSYGSTFASTFPEAYTRKYWTVDAESLSIDWLGPRMPKMSPDEITKGSIPGTVQNLHYITTVRYPNHGGYQSFYQRMAEGANLKLGQEVAAIDLTHQQLWFADGACHEYDRLLSTLPITDFVNRCLDVPIEVRQAASRLDCSQLLLVDVFAPHSQAVPGHWFYVYDEDKWSTRIHCIERLAASNAPPDWTGVQAEVYFSKHKPLTVDPQEVAEAVAAELMEMGFIDPAVYNDKTYRLQWRWCPFANVMFTHARREALELIWNWLSGFGLLREPDDLAAVSDWDKKCRLGTLAMAGRFAQWKYFWTDDCVLRGREIGTAWT